MADLNEMFNKFNNTKDATQEFDTVDIENNKIISIFSYFSILVLIPILAAKDSKYARFHANQGLVLLIASIVLGVIIGVLGRIPFIGWIFALAGGLIEILTLVLMVLGIVNAATGKAKELPIIGNVTILK